MLPAASKASTCGAAKQHELAHGSSVGPFSLVCSESTPRCTTQTRSCASTATPVTDPRIHALLAGNGFGHSGSISSFGAGARCATTPLPAAASSASTHADTHEKRLINLPTVVGSIQRPGRELVRRRVGELVSWSIELPIHQLTNCRSGALSVWFASAR